MDLSEDIQSFISVKMVIFWTRQIWGMARSLDIIINELNTVSLNLVSKSSYDILELVGGG